uniref:Uncharacterized protein n=1 Tax=Anguilla anguilla TaxID=7936 RepID=A0A0E9X5W4_ANGAN
MVFFHKIFPTDTLIYIYVQANMFHQHFKYICIWLFLVKNANKNIDCRFLMDYK